MAETTYVEILEFADHPVNLTTTPLEDFKPGDTLYIQKIISGFMHTYLCKFRRMCRGIVNAEIIAVQNDWNRVLQGTIITTLKRKCYLWGFDPKHRGNRCHWYTKGGWK